MVYQFNSEMQPNTYFHPGDLKYLVPGNEGRWLDPRRTPIRVLEVKRASGFFVIEILDFEDRGARWEVPLEEHSPLRISSNQHVVVCNRTLHATASPKVSNVL